MDTNELKEIRERAEKVAEVERLQAELATVTDMFFQAKAMAEQANNGMEDALSQVKQLQRGIAKAEKDRARMSRAILQSGCDIVSLSSELVNTHAVADDLAALVCRFITVFRLIRPQVGNGARAAIDAALSGVDVPVEKPAGTLAGIVEAEIGALFEDVARMDDLEVSPLEIFKAQQTMLSAWRGYVDGNPQEAPLKEQLEQTEAGLIDAMANARGKQYWAEAWKGLARHYRRILIDEGEWTRQELALMRRANGGNDANHS